MPKEMKALAIEYQAALAAGDRVGAGRILRRIRDLLGNLDEGQLYNGIAFLKTILAALFPSEDGEAKALDAQTLSVEEAEALGILDNPQLWVQLFALLMKLFRAARAE
jgi:hypothetical protein